MHCWPSASRQYLISNWGDSVRGHPGSYTGSYLGSLLGVLFLALCLSLCPLASAANDIEPLEAHISVDDEDVSLSAEFAINLGNRLEDALQRGIPLSFKLECVIERPREYWLSEHVTTYSQTYRLSYSSLTRQYRLAIGSLHQSFTALPDALRVLGRLNNLGIAERSVLRPATRYTAALRLSLDSSQLPKPFQLDALTSNAWKIDAKTKRWEFSSP